MLFTENRFAGQVCSISAALCSVHAIIRTSEVFNTNLVPHSWEDAAAPRGLCLRSSSSASFSLVVCDLPLLLKGMFLLFFFFVLSEVTRDTYESLTFGKQLSEHSQFGNQK